MKQNNMKRKLKAVVAMVLVMASLLSMSSLVNAGIVKWILGDEYVDVVMLSSSDTSHQHKFFGNGIDRGQPMCDHGYQKIYQCSCGEKRIGCTTCNPNLLK